MKRFFLQVFIPLSLIVIWIYKFLFSEPWAVIVDSERYNTYQIYLIRYSWEHFRQFGIWDQFLASGMSWISNPGGPLFSPFTWLIMLATNNLTVMSHMLLFLGVFVAAFSLYYLLRVLGIRSIIAILVCVPYLSNQYVTILVANGFTEELFGLFLIPLTTALLWQAMRKKNIYYALAGGFVMSLHFFQITFYLFHYNLIVLLVVAFGLAIVNILENKKEWKKELAWIIGINLIFYISFIGISCIKLLPLLEFRELSSRNTTPLNLLETSDGVMSFSFFVDRMHYFFFPLGNPIPLDTIFSRITNDLGLVFIGIAIFVAFLKKKWKIFIFLGVLVVAIWGYFANRVPFDLYGFLYYFLPGFCSNKYPYRFFIIIHFAYFVLLAFGADIIFSRRLWGKFIAIGMLCFIAIFTSWYARAFFSEVPFSVSPDFVKNNDTSKNILLTLSKIIKSHAPEGRIYTTFISGDNIIINPVAIRYELPLLNHSYEPIDPTYEYAAVIPGVSSDSLKKTEERYKIFSIYNTRYQLQQNTNTEYEGCFGKPVIAKVPTKGVCNFLESRLKLIFQTSEGGIYYDSQVLPRVGLIPHGVLLIGDNRFHDFSGYIAKQIMFHPDFDEHKMTVFTSPKTAVTDYTLPELSQFDAIILVDPIVKNSQVSKEILQNYVKHGGKILSLHSHWIHYDDLQMRSGSLYTENPAWSFSEEDGKNLSDLFMSLANDTQSTGSVVIKKFTPEDMQYHIVTKKDNEMLQVSDSYYPGWEARVNGKEVTLYMADGLVKGISLPKAGTYDVQLLYRPQSLINGAIISLATLAGVIIFVVVFNNKKKKKIAKKKK